MKTLTTIILIFSTLIMFCQTTFDNIYSNEYRLRSGWQPAIDSENNYYIPFSSINYQGASEYWPGVLKLDQFGNTLDSINLQSIFDVNSYALSSKISILNDTLYAFYKWAETPSGSSDYRAVKMDLELNIIESLTIDFPEEHSINGPLNVEFDDGNFVILANFNDLDPDAPSIFSSGIFFMKISPDFLEVNYEFSQDDDSVSQVFDFAIMQNDKYVIAGVNLWQFNYIESGYPESASLGVFNNDLTPEVTYQINTQIFRNNCGIDSYQDSLFLISGQKITHFDPDDLYFGNDLAVYKLDSDLNVIDGVEIYTQPYVDTLDYTAPQCLSHYYDDQIFFASNRDVRIPYFTMDYPNHIRLVKLDENLDVVWEKFYGGDRANFVNGITATPDGGCIMLCEFYDYEAYPDDFKTDLRIIKVDGDGLVTGIPGSGSFEIKSLLIYPNPSQGLVNIETSLRNYQMIFFDNNGRSIHETGLLSERQQLNLEYLTNGIYPYVVLDEDEKQIEGGMLLLEK